MITTLSTVVVAGITVGQIALAVASVAFQIYQSKKMRKAARDAAEARKGYELTVEGSIQAMPIVYGRAKVGGVRVFCDTSSDFRYAQTDASKTFSLGLAASQRQRWKDLAMGPNGEFQEVEHELPATEGGFLNRSLYGTKNEYLFIQQALCAGPIKGVVDLLIGEMSLKDPSLVSGTASRPKAAYRTDVYNSGNRFCPLVAANFGHRANAQFPGIAFMSTVIRLDRDEPQFNNVPDVQAIMEGRMVRGIDANLNLTDREYTTNPPLCLLDYLLDQVQGGKMTLDQIDLQSFRDAALVAGKVVLTDAAVGGKIWQPLDGAFNILARDLPLYEANIIIDTTKPIRNNIEALLSCMGDARLVWSQGKYKLLLQYPASNEDVQVAGELTDDDLGLDQAIDITWPTTSDRLNYATIRYHDESNDFRENSASWPPKEPGVYPRGIGLKTYAPVSGWSGDSDWYKMLNNLGVWYSAEQQTEMKWTVFIRNAGAYTFKYWADDRCNGEIAGTSFSGAEGERTLQLQKNTVITITVRVEDDGGPKGFAGTLTSPQSLQVWTTRSPAYDRMDIVTQTSEVYDIYLEEDHGLPLETDAFAEGVTDHYHALAKAEELVRTSRSAFVMKFEYFIKDRYFEPGDIIRLRSERLKIPDLLLRVNESVVKDSLMATLTCSRFDWTQLAWNVDDNQATRPNPIWDTALAAPEWIRYEPLANDLGASSGKLVWAPVEDVRAAHYRLYYHPPSEFDSVGQPVWREINRTSDTTLDLPLWAIGAGIFGVRASTAGGTLSTMTMTEPVFLTKGPKPPKAVIKTINSASSETRVDLAWEIPPLREDGTAYNDHMTTVIWRGNSNDVTSARAIGQAAGNTFADTAGAAGSFFYWAQLVSRTSVDGDYSDPAGPVEFFIPGNEIDPGAEPPPAPTALKLTAGLTFFQMEWLNPTHTIGGGHKESRIYAYTWKATDTQPGEFTLVGVSTTDQFFFPANINTKMSFIVRSVSRAGGLSTAYAGPVTGKTGQIGNTDLGDMIVDAGKIANGSINDSKFIPGLEAIRFFTVLPTTFQGNVISVGGILYKWDSLKYVQIVNTTEMVGKIVGAQIQDGALNTAKFAAGLAPVELVSSKPTTGNFEGRVISLTTENGALYRYSGGAWRNSVPAQALEGTITSTQIADNAISTPKLAAGAITADKLGANSVTAGKIASNSIYAGAIQAGAVSAWEIAAGSITTDKIYAGSVTTQKIATYAITSEKIDVGAITADKIAANSINAGKIATGAITADKIAAGAIVVGSAAIENGAIRNALIENGAITSAKIMDAAINTAKIQDAAIGTLKIAGGSVTAMNYNSSGTRYVTRDARVVLASLYIDIPAGGTGIVLNASCSHIVTAGKTAMEMWINVNGYDVSHVYSHSDWYWTFAGLTGFWSGSGGLSCYYMAKVLDANNTIQVENSMLTVVGGKR